MFYNKNVIAACRKFTPGGDKMLMPLSVTCRHSDAMVGNLQNSLKSCKPKRMNSKNIFEHRFEHGHFAACAQFLFAATFQAQIRCVPLLF